MRFALKTTLKLIFFSNLFLGNILPIIQAMPTVFCQNIQHRLLYSGIYLYMCVCMYVYYMHRCIICVSICIYKCIYV